MTAFEIPALPGEPFDVVLDVGGNVGDFAEGAYRRWPDALVISFEPVPSIAALNRRRGAGRWSTIVVACSSERGTATLYVCTHQHEASTMQEPGPARRRAFGIVDSWAPIQVPTERLDEFLIEPLALPGERLLVKVDVEGHELAVLLGAERTLERATTVVVEVQNDPTIFLGSAPAWEVDTVLRGHGLHFCGLAGALLDPGGGVLQFDGVWSREQPRAFDGD